MDAPRVVIVSDDPLTRAGLAALLAGHGELMVVGSATIEGWGAPENPLQSQADVAVVDLPSHGAGARDQLAFPAVVLVLDEREAPEAVEAGARGVLLRNASTDQLASALVAVHRGLVVLDPALARWVRPPVARDTADARSGLTPRESQVLALLAEGLSNKAIAARMGIAERTAKFHVESILAKLGAETRSEAIVLAARRGLVAL